MGSFGTGVGTFVNTNSGSVAVTPPTSATIMIGGIAIGYGSAPTVNAMTWDGNNMTVGPNRNNATDGHYVGIDYYVSPGASALNVAGGGGNASDLLHIMGIGIAGSETSSPVRDSTTGQVTGGTDISWSPTGVQAGDLMVVVAIAFNQSLAAGTGTSADYLDDNSGAFDYSGILAHKVATGGSDTIDVACGGLTDYACICIKTAAAGTPVTIFVQNYD